MRSVGYFRRFVKVISDCSDCTSEIRLLSEVWMGRVLRKIVVACALLVSSEAKSEWKFFDGVGEQKHTVMATLIDDGYVAFTCRSGADLKLFYNSTESLDSGPGKSGSLVREPNLQVIVDKGKPHAMRALYSMERVGTGTRYEVVAIADVAPVVAAMRQSTYRLVASFEFRGAIVSRSVLDADGARDAFGSLWTACGLETRND